MTGFGKAEYLNDNRKITVELKTLNSKQADLTIKVPNMWKDRELDMRNELLNQLQRGKIELYISMEDEIEGKTPLFNETAIKNYFLQLSEFSAQNNIPMPPDIIKSLVLLPDVLKLDRQTSDEKEWLILLDALKQALNQVNRFREQEGLALKEDMTNRVKLIESYISEVEEFEPQRIELIKSRLNQSLIEYIGETIIDKNRFEQELIYYLEKMDINEEKVRLRNHCSYFLATATEDAVIGKKLGFIAQEMGREINTIGSKANHADMQTIVIKMKDELEKIKEQLLNIL